VKGFAIDPAQDLLVLIRDRFTERILECCSLATGRKHPDAWQDNDCLGEMTQNDMFWLHSTLVLVDHIVVQLRVYREGRHHNKVIVYN